MKNDSKSVPTPAASQAIGDRRQVREILLDIETMLRSNTKPAVPVSDFPTREKLPRVRNFARKLSPRLTDALDILLVDTAVDPNAPRRNFAQLLAALQDLEPGCVRHKSGELNFAIMAYCARRLGIDVRTQSEEIA